MPAPNDFENLQSVYMRVYNKLVRESFREDIGDEDFSTPESQMKYACMIRDNDTAQMMQLRSNLFLFIREEAKTAQPAIYGIPVEEYQDSVAFRPQVQLYFEETRASRATHDRQMKRLRVSWRLVNETSQSLTEGMVQAMRVRIGAQFPRAYTFKTGRTKINYRDKEVGAEWQVLSHTEGEGKHFLKKLARAAGFNTLNVEHLSVSYYPERNFNGATPITILGKRHRLPERRRIADVYLRRAELKIHGNLTDVQLYETW